MPQGLYRHPLTIPLQDIDAAGVVFFAHLFRYAHEAYEAWMAENGLGLAGIIQKGAWHLPLVHAEADYHLPLRHGESLSLLLEVERLGESAFTLCHTLEDDSGRQRATVRTVHVAIDAQSRQKRPLPDELRELLGRYSAG